MSQVKISGNASGTGVLTIAAPNTDTDRSITIPDKAGAIAIGAGTVVQYAEKEYTTAFSTTSSTYVDAFTGFTFTPTSATNKVRIEFFGRFYSDAASTDCSFQIVRDSTNIWTGASLFIGAATNGFALCSSIIHLDSPATTSQVTYKLQGKRISGSGQCRVLASSDNALNPDPYFRAWEIVA